MSIFFDANALDDVAFARLRLEGSHDICDVGDKFVYSYTLHVYGECDCLKTPL